LESAVVSGRFGSRVKEQIPDAGVRIRGRYTPPSRSIGEGPGGLIRARYIIVTFVALALAGCSAFAPFETQTPNLGPGGQRQQTSQQMVTAAGASPAYAPVSVCYSRLAAGPDQVKAIAAEECNKGETPQLVDQGIDLVACPLLIPVRATFSCVAH
jgi:hypothetical protein